jgi:uncharacterized protein
MEALLSIKTEKVAFTWHAPTAAKPANNAGRTSPVGTCRILPRRASLTLQQGTQRAGVPQANAADVHQIAGPPLFEETTYSILLSSLDGRSVELRHRDPNLLRDVRTTDDGSLWHGNINFRSQVGISRFSVISDGVPEFDVELEVFPSKIEYRSDYAAMMGDVQDLAAGLALEYLRSTHQFGSHLSGRLTSRLEWIALLRYVVDDLNKAIAYIAQRPIRGLHRQSAMVRVEALRRSDGALRRAVRAGSGRGSLITLNSGVPVRRYLPERRPEHTLDTPEHRWLAAELRAIRTRLASIVQEERLRQNLLTRRGSGSISDRDIQALHELENLEARVARLETSEPLAAAEGLPPSGFASLQLQGAPGYRESYRSLKILRLGLRVHGGPVELSVKDIHVLYEYWCFLAIIRLLADVLQTPIPARHLFEVRTDGLRIRLQQGRAQTVPFELSGGRTLAVSYNPSYNDADMLLPQQPDIVLTFSDPDWPTIRLVLDAKYRVQDDDEYINRFGVAGPPPDAVNVLHRYRDAILENIENALPDKRRRRNVIEGAALYPLSADRAGDFENSRFFRSLERLGIGALPFLPGSTDWVERWLRGVLKRSGWQMAQAVIPHTSQQQYAYWKSASEVAVLVGVLRGSDPQGHMKWIEAERLYYTKLTPTQRRQLQVKHVAIYEPIGFRGGKLGQVRRWFSVEEVDVIRRDDLFTPWPARDNNNDLQVVYRLSAIHDLDRPIVNRNGTFRRNRWTSLLGLNRAEDVSQLMLESVEEWTVFDMLRTLGVKVRLEAAHRPREEPGRGSRVWFVISNGRIRLIEPDLIEVHRGGLIKSGNIATLEAMISDQ